MRGRLRRVALAVAGLVAALALAGAAGASEARPTLDDLEDEVMCPTCESLLELSNAPAANRIRQFIVDRIEAGDTKSEIKDALVADFGDEILAAPPKSGANLVAWLLPLVGALGALVVVALVLRRMRASRAAAGPAEAAEAGAGTPIDAALQARIDDELARYDS